MAEPLTHYATSTEGLVSDIQPRIACRAPYWAAVSDDPLLVTCGECRAAARKRTYPWSRLSLCLEPRDAWVGIYNAPGAVYICLVPFVVIRYRKQGAR